MDVGLGILMFVVGLGVGTVSGLLGIGGGIIAVPLLLYVPPALGFAAFGMKAVAGITTVQSFAGAVSGAFGHTRHRRVHPELALYLGIPMALACLVGSRLSTHVSEDMMLLVFAAMAFVASAMMLLPKREAELEETLEDVRFSRALAVVIGAGIGSLSGIIGQGGAFLYVPAMLYILSIPTRITIGSALAIGILSAGAVLMGCLGTAQIPWFEAGLVVLGVILGSQAGTALSQRTPRVFLRRALAVVILGTAVKIAMSVAP